MDTTTSKKDPKGFVLAVENAVPIGQLELTVKEYEGKDAKIGSWKRSEVY